MADAARIQLVISQITEGAHIARIIDPATKGRVSYAAMCGTLQGALKTLAQDIGGDEALGAIVAALTEAYDDETPTAAGIIARAEARHG